jgi:hypothetical protein
MKSPAAWRHLLFAVGIALLIASAFGCGGVQEGGGPDGSEQDAGGDKGPLSDGKEGLDAIAVDRLGDRADTAAQNDGSMPSDAFPPPPFDAARFASCSPDPCGMGQMCVFFMPSNQRAQCEGIPTECRPSPTCACIEEAAAWCHVTHCAVDGGDVVLTCMTPVPP